MKWSLNHSASNNIELPKLKVLTYNVWFADHGFEIRGSAITELLYDSDADFICLQEVVPLFVRTFITPNEKLRSKYKYIHDLTEASVRPYGVLMLSKYPFAKVQFIELETYMTRKLLLADFIINGQLVGIGTVHLESLNTSPIRKKQLKQISNVLSKGYRHWILMGDFNFDSQINFNNREGPIENDMLQECIPEALDCWLYLNSEDPSSGKTYDSVVNNMLDHYEQMRYDRVMLHSHPKKDTKATWTPVNAQLVGTKPINPRLWPSDHFGVFVEFVYNT